MMNEFKKEIMKITEEKAINQLLKDMRKEKDRIEKEERTEQRNFTGQASKSLTDDGLLEAKINYLEYILPVLNRLDNKIESNKQEIAKAKAEYHERIKEPMKELEALENKTQELIAKGGGSNTWNYERNTMYNAGDKKKASYDIGKTVLDMAINQRKNEADRKVLKAKAEREEEAN